MQRFRAQFTSNSTSGTGSTGARRKASWWRPGWKAFTSLALASALSTIPVARVGAGSGDIVEHFTATKLNKAAWLIQKAGNGPSLRVGNGRLDLRLPATAHSAPKQTEFFVGIDSQCSFTGDVDVRATFILMNWAPYNGARAGLRLDPVKYSRKDGVHIERASWSALETVPAGRTQEVYASNFYDGVSSSVTTEMAGRLRLVRRGKRITSYVYREGGWVLMHSGPGPTGAVRVGVRLWAHDQSFEHEAVRVTFDNIRIMKGHPTCALSALPR